MFQGRLNPLFWIYLEKLPVDLSRIPAQPKAGLINVLIEIPGGSKNKYEFDKDMNAFALDRVLFSSVKYPYDYGFVPNTLADDGDPSMDGDYGRADLPWLCHRCPPHWDAGNDRRWRSRRKNSLCSAEDPRYNDIKSIKQISSTA